MFYKWDGSIDINGVHYESNHLIPPNLTIKGGTNILLTPRPKPIQTALNEEISDDKEVQITVKTYMTKKSTPEFGFMAQWNDDIPMPLRTMVGKKVKETPGMVYMKLHGDITQEVTPVCLKCGKPITNKVSQYFGMGPECGQHNYVNPFNSYEDLKDAVEKYKRVLRDMKWEGWIPKSSITSEVKI